MLGARKILASPPRPEVVVTTSVGLHPSNGE
jgi:hypothetical protein